MESEPTTLLSDKNNQSSTIVEHRCSSDSGASRAAAFRLPPCHVPTPVAENSKNTSPPTDASALPEFSVADTTNGALAQQPSELQKRLHQLPQFSFSKDHHDSPLLANGERGVVSFDRRSSGATLPERERMAALPSRSNARHLSLRLPLALSSCFHPASSYKTSTCSTVTSAEVPVRTRNGISDTVVAQHALHRCLEEPPRASSAKVSMFEQRRIPLPPPAMGSNTLGDQSSSGSPRGVSSAPPAIPKPTHTMTGTKQGKSGVQHRSYAQRGKQLQSQQTTPPLPASSAALCVAPLEESHPDIDGSLSGHVSLSSPLNSTSSPINAMAPAMHSSLLAPVSPDTAVRIEKSTNDAPDVQAPTLLRNAGATQFRLPPLPQPASASSAAAMKADVTALEQPQMGLGLFQWPHMLLLRTFNTESLCYGVQPATAPSALPLPVVDINDNDVVIHEHSNSADLVRPGRSREAQDRLGPMSAIEVTPAALTSPYVAEAALRPVCVAGSRSIHSTVEAALRQQEGSQQQRYPKQQKQHQQPVRHAPSRLHTSFVSRCPTPDGVSAETSAPSGKREASPKGVGGGALRRSLPSDRLVARSSSTSLIVDSHRESSGWSRSEVGLWGGSSRHLNVSTLTISCAPAFGSFSANSDSSLIL
ncbi:hypothetical protein ABL78_6974 [Leptomonas seymouri]|uniref:Uncharacterized protein n=1 Tax=Leptomonas seymouri TaxID=5684 RepID=A0A0N1IHP4_LEPSE|nr:hypothetical protein ABL78_6974 [Leptomonas seymouri]|eukprot:KPI83982.1 hypothetical protein ABL78_6974 [Leptomonas seymouri]